MIVDGWLVGCSVLSHINLYRFFNTKSIFIQVICLFQKIQFNMSTVFVKKISTSNYSV